MIRHGFIRCEEGEWHSLVGVDKIVIVCETYEDDEEYMRWQIDVRWEEGRNEDYCVTIASGFECPDEAQAYLDKMMKGV